MKDRIVRFCKSLLNFYNTWYGVINTIVGLYLISKFNSSIATIVLIVFIGIDIFTWIKNIWRNMGTKRELFATIKQNNSLCIYGGIGSGKSTFGEFIMHEFIPENKRYYNTIRPGYKAVTNEHFLLKKRFEDGAGVLIDEAGGQADAYHYEKKDNETRKRIDYLNKFFRQWYTDKALLIYIDQCQSNMNTSLYKNIYYVIQCKGVDVKPSGLLPHLICKFFLYFINKYRDLGAKINNPFSNVSIEFMEFVKLGDYADHYNVEIKDKDHKHLVGSIYKFFTGQNTYVFRDFNPAKYDLNPYIWGVDSNKDKKVMRDNFNFEQIEQDIKETFLKH